MTTFSAFYRAIISNKGSFFELGEKPLSGMALWMHRHVVFGSFLFQTQKKQCLENIANIFESLLKDQLPQNSPLTSDPCNPLEYSPSDSTEDYVPLLVRCFLDEAKANNVPIAKKALLKELSLKYCLDIPQEAYDVSENEGFFEFAAKAFLDRRLLNMRESVKLSEQGIISLKYQNRWTPWHEIRAAFKNFNDFKKELDFPIYYNTTGVVCTSAQGQTEPQIVRRVEDTISQAFIEIRGSCDKEIGTRRTGDHIWPNVKLENKESVYSMALYRPLKKDTSKEVWRQSPFRLQDGIPITFDYSDDCPIEIQSIRFYVENEKAEKVLKKFSEDLERGIIPFQIFQQNCTRYTLDLLKEADIHIPDTYFKRHIFTLYAPKIAVKTAETLSKILPLAVQKVTVFAVSFFINLAQWYLGAFRGDAKALKLSQPLMTSWKDLFNIDKCYAWAPYGIFQLEEDLKGLSNEEILKKFKPLKQ